MAKTRVFAVIIDGFQEFLVPDSDAPAEEALFAADQHGWLYLTKEMKPVFDTDKWFHKINIGKVRIEQRFADIPTTAGHGIR